MFCVIIPHIEEEQMLEAIVVTPRSWTIIAALPASPASYSTLTRYLTDLGWQVQVPDAQQPRYRIT